MTARELLAGGIRPRSKSEGHKAVKQGQAANSFEVIAREWFAKFSHEWPPTHSDKIIKRLEKDVFPWMGNRPISEIKPPEFLAVIRRTESGAHWIPRTASSETTGQVFRYAVATGRAERDPSQDLKKRDTLYQEKSFCVDYRSCSGWRAAARNRGL